MPALAERFHVLSLDFRGHGKSGRATDYQPQGYVTDAIAVLEQLASGPAIVIGHSLGGVTAAALSQQRPELVRAMVLEDPPLGSTETGADLEGHAISEGFRLMKAGRARCAGGRHAGRCGGGDDVDPAVVERRADGPARVPGVAAGHGSGPARARRRGARSDPGRLGEDCVQPVPTDPGEDPAADRRPVDARRGVHRGRRRPSAGDQPVGLAVCGEGRRPPDPRREERAAPSSSNQTEAFLANL